VSHLALFNCVQRAARIGGTNSTIRMRQRVKRLPNYSAKNGAQGLHRNGDPEARRFVKR
jgi:hypothetical protein